MPGRIRRFSECGCKAWVQRSIGGTKFRVIANWCRDRFCPLCGKKRSRVAAQIIHTLVEPRKDRCRFLTLTMRHTSGQSVTQLIDRVLECFSRLRDRHAWKNHVKGGVGTLECKRSKDGGWHVHLHLLIEGCWWKKSDISHEWLAVTGDSTVCFIKPLYSDAKRNAFYVAKYIGKPADAETLAIPGSLDQLVVALRARRTLMRFGAWYASKDDDDREQPEIWVDWKPLDQVYYEACSGDESSRTVLAKIAGSGGSPVNPLSWDVECYWQARGSAPPTRDPD